MTSHSKIEYFNPSNDVIHFHIQTCLRVANGYLKKKEFGFPMVLLVKTALFFLLSRLLHHGRYLTPIHTKFSLETPGFGLAGSNGLISLAMLKDAWQYALRQFVHDKQWTKDEVTAYFTLLCTNKGTINHFI
jgi:hypothetical protein